MSNTAAAETLEALTNKTDNADLHKFLLDCSPEERRNLAPTALKLYRRAVKGGIKMRSDNSFGYESPAHILGAVTTAVFCTASKEEIESLSINWMAIEQLNQQILWKIKPPSLECLAETFLNASLAKIYEVRQMIKENLIPPCDAEVYIIALIGCPYTVREPLNEWLLKNDDVLKTDVWRFFEVEGTQENNLAAVDKYSGNKWGNALLKLTNDGHLPRRRMLGESLSALGRPFIQFRAGWFSRFHESLNPTIEERIELLEEYGKLLGSPIGPTVSFAIKAWQTIDQKHPIPVSSIKSYLPPALLSESKATVSGALSILQKAVKRDSGFALEAHLMAIEALQHQSSDVQEKVLDFLEKSDACNNTAVRERIAACLDTVAPSLSKRLETLVNSLSVSGASTDTKVMSIADAVKTKLKTESFAGEIEYIRTNTSSPGWPFACAQALEPITGIDELIDRAALCLENHTEVLEMERVFDGISRIDTTSSADFTELSKPLLKRTEKLIEEHRWKSLCHQIYMKTLTAWLTKDETRLGADPRCKLPVEVLLFNRLRRILSRLKKGQFLPTLALPEHPGGWLSADTLIKRAKIWKDAQVPIELYELAFSLHRIPEEEVVELVAGKNVDPALQEAFSIAAGVKSRLSEIAHDQSDQFTNSSVFTMSYPENESEMLKFIAHSAAGFELEKRKWKTKSDATFIRYCEIEIIRWDAISFPALRENFLELGTRCATACINYMDVPSRSIRGFLEVLCESGAPLVHHANTLAAAGLMLGDPELSGVNIDALILAISERRLETQALGQEVSTLLHSSDGKPRRLAHALGEIARVSPLHAQAVLQILEFTLQGKHAETHKELWAVLDAYNELLIANGAKITNPKTVAYLSALSTLGKTGKLAKSLLALAKPAVLMGND